MSDIRKQREEIETNIHRLENEIRAWKQKAIQLQDSCKHATLYRWSSNWICSDCCKSFPFTFTVSQSGVKS